MTSEKFSLKWNDYQTKWGQSLSGLRNDTELSDVTLITDDKVKMSAHKILLSSCSNVFNFILKESKQTSPLLYLGGISSVNLGFILDYIYHGEVNLYQEQLDGFLESAQKLEISGLIGDSQSNQNNQECKLEDINNSLHTVKEESHKSHEQHMVNTNENDQTLKNKSQFTGSISKNGQNYDVTGLNSEEISEKIKSMYQKVDGFWTCNECGKISNNKTTSGDIRLHVETHLDGLCYTCNNCSREFRSKAILKTHKQTTHKNHFQD